MLTPEDRDRIYADGYAKIPTLMVDGEQHFSQVAHRRGLSELAWASNVDSLIDAAIEATLNGKHDLAEWLSDRANIMIMERDELALSNPFLNQNNPHPS